MDPAEDVFAGPPQSPPAPRDHSGGEFVPVEDILRIRHVGGYAPFLTFCTTHHAGPPKLAGDLAALVIFLHETIRDLQHDPALSAAATVFTGNTLAGLRPDARWERATDGTITVGTDDEQFDPALLLENLHTATQEEIQSFLEAVEDWVHWDPLPIPTPPPLPGLNGTAAYTRPPLPRWSFSTADGEPIPYGHLWEEHPPPQEAYSRTTHPERFAGLHQVAAALIDHLTTTYHVTAHEGPAGAQDLLDPPDHVLRTVRLTPALAEAAPLTIVLTPEPAVIVHAGVLCELTFPDCPCDACDTALEDQADELEHLVLAVAAGTFQERYPVGHQRTYDYTWAAPDGSSSSGYSGTPPTDSPTRLHHAEDRLAGLPHGWQPWPPSPPGRT
jgi:hypothetical protein